MGDTCYWLIDCFSPAGSVIALGGAYGLYIACYSGVVMRLLLWAFFMLILIVGCCIWGGIYIGNHSYYYAVQGIARLKGFIGQLVTDSVSGA